ncbi:MULTISPECIES: hypothetical protein [unclassified Variovorax]|uniref:hypothetical protein n=1 Tax=unclassified Variovorax TaxID=663243 RepID=UPI00076C821C|nr:MULTISPECIES: hypothetical protein [unclassified Variovorax]KWT98106.1 hypothetical protein APY03_0777 [Variovorax sp. WDL1]PNG50418.1 hypothetical protein CHC06_06042 [Variovorax sp. B2]PNG51291.1 hypothetical protein CHC07_05948 [Variovorax sp. B4]VTV17546.1 hypothetical protein WDL1P1_00474 [Variovorax sp. WDL1]
MKKSLLALAAIAAFGLSLGVHAETYDGVHVSASSKNRAEVNIEAVVEAKSIDLAAEPGRGVLTVASVASKEAVRAQAVAAAHAPDQNVKPSSRVNSKVVSTFNHTNIASK